MKLKPVSVQAMDAIRASKGAEEARKHAATLQRLTAATRASMEQHVRAEEQEVGPEHALYTQIVPIPAGVVWHSSSQHLVYRARQREYVL